MCTLAGIIVTFKICAEYHVQVLCHKNDTNQWTFIVTIYFMMHIDSTDGGSDMKCLCQVFYHRQGFNRWRTTLAFCTRDYLDVSCIHDCRHLLGIL